MADEELPCGACQGAGGHTHKETKEDGSVHEWWTTCTVCQGTGKRPS